MLRALGKRLLQGSSALGGAGKRSSRGFPGLGGSSALPAGGDSPGKWLQTPREHNDKFLPPQSAESANLCSTVESLGKHPTGEPITRSRCLREDARQARQLGGGVPTPAC